MHGLVVSRFGGTGTNKLRHEANMTADDVSKETLSERHPEQQDDPLDEVEEESFPASDPQSSWAGPNPDAGQ